MNTPILVVLCQCEHTEHWEGVGHGYLAVAAGTQRAEFVGQICDACANGHLRAFVLETEMGPQLAIVYVEARAWLADCFASDEDDVDRINDYSDRKIKAAVNRNYEGGWDAFVLNCHDLVKEETHDPA